MKLQRYITFFAMLTLMLTMRAQVPGFMGKRFSVGLQPGFTNAFSNPNSSGNMTFEPKYYNASSPAAKSLGPRQQVMSLDLSPSVFMGFVARRDLVIGLSYCHFTTKAYGGTHNLSYQYPDTSFVTSLPVFPNNAAVGMFDIRGNSVSLFFKQFFRSYIAPFGKYFRAEIMYINYTATYDPAKVYAEQQFYNQSGGQPFFARVPNVSFGNTRQTFSRVDAFVGLGKQRVFFDRLVIDRGVKVSFSGMFRVFSDGANSSLPGSYIKELSRQRLIARNTFSFYIGVSWLLF